MSNLLLLDSASLYFRAFFGVPDSLKAPDGTVINALRGMLDFTATLVESRQPSHVVACWDDDWRPQWRVDLIDTYKTHRVADPVTDTEEVPDLLSPQVPLIAEAMELLGIPVVGAAEAEADDVIGTLAARATAAVEVVTGDRDLFQLVDEDKPVRVLYTIRGIGNLELIDDAWVRAKYGVGAAQYVDFSVMRGDASDGLPGVRGIGEKTAATLLAEFGDIVGIQEAAADPASSLRPRIRESLLESADYIAAARTVVRVRDDLVLPEPKPLLALTEDAIAEAKAFADRWGVTNAMGRAITAINAATR